MPLYRVTAPARAQLAGVLARSVAEYCESAALHYGQLLEQAMNDVGADPARPGARRLRGMRGILVYDIRHSRMRTPRDQRVRDPWHKLIYRQRPEGVVEILAIVGLSYPSSRAARNALAGS